jgi:glycerophosphoryl diester phosphodiesterase
VVVVIHDDTVERTTNGTGAVRSLTLSDLQRLDAGRGFRVPTLAALLEAVADAPVNIEIKQDDPPIESAVLATLDRFGARDRTLLAAEHAHIMHRIRAAAPEVLTSFSAPEVADFVFRVRDANFSDYRPPGIALQVPPVYGDTPIITPDFVAAAHRFDLEVHAWTINTSNEIETLLDLGVDGIMTDLPDVAMEVFRRRNLR